MEEKNSQRLIMTEDAEKDLLEKIASCLEKGDLDACVGEAIVFAKKMEISLQRLLELSEIQNKAKQYKHEYILALAAAEGLDNKAPAYNNAGNASIFLHNFEIAEELFKKAINADPNCATTYNNLGVLLADLERKDEAEKQYRLAIKADPNHAGAYSNLGVLLADLGRKDEAVEQHRLAIKANPNLAAAYYNLGVLLVDLGRKDEAMEQYRLAIKADPNHAGAYSNLGVLLSDLGRKDEAVEQYRLAIKANPNFSEAHNNYGNLLREYGRFGEAEKEVRIALDIDPLNPNYHGTLGDVLADEGWQDESEKEYKFALEHSDKMDDSAKSEIHNNLGWIYAKKKLYYNAKDEFFKARTIDPRNIKAIRNLRAVGRVKPSSELTNVQIVIAILLFLALLLSIYLFFISKLNETSFTALFMYFPAIILFALLYKSIGRFSVGPKGVEFEKSDEHRLALAQAQTAEFIFKFER